MHRRTTVTVIALLAALGTLAVGCKRKIVHQAVTQGLPEWINTPCFDCEDGEIAGFARSDVAALDFNTAKAEAETLAQAAIAQQLEAEVTYLVELTGEMMTDVDPDRVTSIGNRTRKQMDETFVYEHVRGVEFTDYYYLPDANHPEAILVRAKTSLDREALAREVLGAYRVELDQLAEELESGHEENIMRLEQVREQYLQGRTFTR
jgi:hypothetical protein